MSRRDKVRDAIEDTIVSYQETLHILDELSDIVARYYDDVVKLETEMKLLAKTHPERKLGDFDMEILATIRGIFDYANSKARKMRLGND